MVPRDIMFTAQTAQHDATDAVVEAANTMGQSGPLVRTDDLIQMNEDLLEAAFLLAATTQRTLELLRNDKANGG